MPTSCSHQMGFVNDFFTVVTIKLLLFVIFVRGWEVVNEIFVRVPSGGLMHAEEAVVYFSHRPRSSHHACSHSFSWLFPDIFFCNSSSRHQQISPRLIFTEYIHCAASFLNVIPSIQLLSGSCDKHFRFSSSVAHPAGWSASINTV